MEYPNNYKIGDKVEVHAFGFWYRGEVVKIGRNKVTARYTSGTGTTREKALDEDQIRRPGASEETSTRMTSARKRREEQEFEAIQKQGELKQGGSI